MTELEKSECCHRLLYPHPVPTLVLCCVRAGNLRRSSRGRGFAGAVRHVRWVRPRHEAAAALLQLLRGNPGGVPGYPPSPRATMCFVPAHISVEDREVSLRFAYGGEVCPPHCADAWDVWLNPTAIPFLKPCFLCVFLVPCTLPCCNPLYVHRWFACSLCP